MTTPPTTPELIASLHAATDADGRRRLADLLAHARLAAFVAAPVVALGLLVWAALAGGPS